MALRETALDRLEALAPLLQNAIAPLPEPNALGEASIPVFGARDAAHFTRILGIAASDPAAGWMAATVFHSILLVNLDVVDAARAHGGRERLGVFKRGLLHEICHLALRFAGVRIPVRLEEGLCEHISQRPATLERIPEGTWHLESFRAFALDCRAGVAAPTQPASWKPLIERIAAPRLGLTLRDRP